MSAAQHNNKRAPEPKGITPAKKKQRVDEEDPEAKLAFHLAAAKPLILAALKDKMRYHREFHDGDSSDEDGMRENKKKTKLWKSLKGTEWHNDVDVCIKALENGVLVKRLEGSACLKNQADVLKLFRRKPPSTRLGKKLWTMICPSLHLVPKIAYTALNRSYVSFDALDVELKSKAAVLGAIADKRLRWFRLPDHFKRDVDFALAAAKTGVLDNVGEALQMVDNKQKLWVEWVFQNPDATRELPEVWTTIPEEFRANRELFTDVILKCPFVVNYLPAPLSNDLNFFESILEKDIKLMAELSVNIFDRFPSLLHVRWLEKFVPHDEHWKLHIPGYLWNDRDFLLNHWLKAGFNMEHMAQHFWNDEEIILTHAKCYKGTWDYDVMGFHRLSLRLGGDRAFVRKLLEALPPTKITAFRTIFKSIEALEDCDIDLQLLAFFRCGDYPFFDDERRQFRNTVRTLLLQRRQFDLAILHGVKDQGSLMRLLDQGDNNIKRTIFRFLHVPTGERLQWVEFAAEKLGLSATDGYET